MFAPFNNAMVLREVVPLSACSAVVFSVFQMVDFLEIPTMIGLLRIHK
jgi:hypothetical protein